MDYQQLNAFISIYFYEETITIVHPVNVHLSNENHVGHPLAGSFKFAEGPFWHPGDYLKISDIALNRIFQIYLNGVMHVSLHNRGGMFIRYKNLSDMIGSNGLALVSENNLIFCQHGNHSIAKMDKAKNIT